MSSLSAFHEQKDNRPREEEEEAAKEEKLVNDMQWQETLSLQQRHLGPTPLLVRMHGSTSFILSSRKDIIPHRNRRNYRHARRLLWLPSLSAREHPEADARCDVRRLSNFQSQRVVFPLRTAPYPADEERPVLRFGYRM